jgi:putative SOS response-associated peptidase YedK
MRNLYTYKMSAEDMRLLKAHYSLVGREYLDVLATKNDAASVWPNYAAPVILERLIDSGGVERVIEPMLWAMPAPEIAGTSRGVTNVRNTASRYWKRWLKDPASRCIVPVSRFAEPDDRASKPVINRWFHRPDDSLFFFPGIWTEWQGDRSTKAKPNVGRHKLYAFRAQGRRRRSHGERHFVLPDRANGSSRPARLIEPDRLQRRYRGPVAGQGCPVTQVAGA